MATETTDYAALTPWAVMNAMVLYWYNVRHTDKAEALFEGADPAYLGEKSMQMDRKGLDGFWGDLDYAHQCKLVSLARARYMGESVRREQLNAQFEG